MRVVKLAIALATLALALPACEPAPEGPVAPAAPAFSAGHNQDGVVDGNDFMIWAVQPANLDLFAVAGFSWDGSVVAFGDQSGGGGAARCVDPADDQGRIWFVDALTGTELGSYKIPRSETGVCTATELQFVPLTRGRKVLVSTFYTGGVSVVDVDHLRLRGRSGDRLLQGRRGQHLDLSTGTTASSTPTTSTAGSTS